MKFEDRAFAELTQAKKKFGEYAYHDKGAHEVMDVDSLAREVKRMGTKKAGEALTVLATKEDTHGLMTSILSSLDDWDDFDDMLELYPDLGKFY